jgi:DNA modification methylase/superfamily II DNA or RNA helicase
MTYEQLLESKVKRHIDSGFEADSAKWEWLYPFQKYAVKKALKAGKFAMFEDCGLGKTRQQLTFAYEVSEHTQGLVLVLAPLGVIGQTVAEGQAIGIEVKEYEGQTNKGIYIINYEQLDNINASLFSGVVLDESSIIKHFTGATRNKVITNFANTPYKLACTATPSPNDELELGNHSEFLGNMSSQDMRAMFFTTDKSITKGDKYKLKSHAVKEFYQWISTWAIMVDKPSAIGFSDEGYNLPQLNFHEIQLTTDKKDNGLLFNDVAVSATNHNAELRNTMDIRIGRVAEIVNNSTDNFIVWIKHNDEGDMLRKLIPDAVEVKGSDTPEYKKAKLLGFGKNEFRVLITKSKIAQFGLNYQNCHKQVFASLDFSFESLYQSIRRSYRFGQKNEVDVYLITTDTMENVTLSIKEKEAKFRIMQAEMREAEMSNYNPLEKSEATGEIYKGDNFTVINGDCVAEVAKLPASSIDFCFFSPPFGAMYVFSDDPRDLSNVKNDDEFYNHFRFLVKELKRVMKAGRLVSLHIMQSTTLLGRDGYYSIKDFRGDIIRLFQSEGFYFHAEVMIRKDPKTAAIRTKNRQLMHGTTKNDSSINRPGLADFIITFRNEGDNEVPIKNNIPFDLWCKIAEPVWIDIEEGDTVRFRDAKGDKDERHITPTQLTPIKYCYLMWCNEGETVLSPFSGVASEGIVAVTNNRKYIGIELKKSYFDASIKNLKSAELSKTQATLL